MTRIAVTQNTLVDFGEDRWRLIAFDEQAKPSLLVEVRAGRNFRYDDYFGATRALPPLGEVAARDIGDVVLGWSDDAAAWQLGMTLSPDLSLSRSSRWFEVIRFDDPAAEEAARQIGQALADVMGKRFAVTGRPIDEVDAAPLVELPLDLGIWQLDEDAGMSADAAGAPRLRLTRKQSWFNARLRQIAWYGVLAALYAWVSIASLTSDLGLPNAGTLINTLVGRLIPDPILLPYLGLVVFALLLLLIMRQVWHLQRAPDSLVVDSEKRQVSAWRGDQLRWRITADEVQSVYASELVKRRGKGLVVQHGEINLLLQDDKFRCLLVDEDKRNDAALSGVDAAAEKARPAGVAPLPAEAAATAIQAAAVHIAVALGDLPVWYDRRSK